jgi:hypothetical protein
MVAGLDMSSFSLVCVEKSKPHCVQIVQLSDKALATGHEQNHKAMRLIAQCLKDKQWPGPGDGHIFTTSLSDWYLQRAEA